MLLPPLLQLVRGQEPAAGAPGTPHCVIMSGLVQVRSPRSQELVLLLGLRALLAPPQDCRVLFRVDVDRVLERRQHREGLVRGCLEEEEGRKASARGAMCPEAMVWC